MKIVGEMLISPLIFYGMTLREAKLAMKGHNNKLKNDYYLNMYATTNAVGSCFGGKKFKPIDPFNSTRDSRKDADYVRKLKAIGIDARDVNEEWDNSWNDLSVEEKRKLLFNK